MSQINHPSFFVGLLLRNCTHPTRAPSLTHTPLPPNPPTLPTPRPQINHPSFFVGLLLRNCTLPVAQHGHVVLARPSPILFYPISSKEVR